MLEKIKDELSKCLNDIYEFDYDSIKSNINTVLNNHKNELANFNVICDDSNNSPRQIKNKNECFVDIYIQPIATPAFINVKFTILPDKIKALRKLRKEKLKSIGII